MQAKNIIFNKTVDIIGNRKDTSIWNIQALKMENQMKKAKQTNEQQQQHKKRIPSSQSKIDGVYF